MSINEWGSPPTDFPFNVATGKYAGLLPFFKFGTGKVASSPTTLWSGSDTVSGIYPYLSSAKILFLSSSNANDINSGSGAWAVEIIGVDENYQYTIDVVTLNGTALVPTNKAFFRVFRMRVYLAGSEEGAIGEISLEDDIGTILARIEIEDGISVNQTQMTNFSIPAGYTAFIYGANVTAYDTKKTNVFLRTREAADGPNSVLWRIRVNFRMRDQAISVSPTFPLLVREKTDVEVMGYTESGNAGVSANFSILLVSGIRVPDYQELYTP